MFLALDTSNTIFLFDLMGAQGQQVQAVQLQLPAAAAAKEPVVPCCFWNAGTAAAAGGSGGYSSSLGQSSSLLGRRMEARQAPDGGATTTGVTGSSSAATATAHMHWFAVGYSNGSALFFRLAEGLQKIRPKEIEKLKELLVQ